MLAYRVGSASAFFTQPNRTVLNNGWLLAAACFSLIGDKRALVLGEFPFFKRKRKKELVVHMTASLVHGNGNGISNLMTHL